MRDSVSISGLGQEDRERIGKRLIAFAWGVEIIAAGIGFLIAILIVIGTRAQITQVVGETEATAAAGVMNAFLGGLPFIMVGVVELTKIPLATACYHSSTKFWRIVFVTGLAFLMVITFETILNGFERNFTQRTYVVKQQRKNLIQTEEEIAKADAEIVVLAAVTPESLRKEFENEIAQIAGNREDELKVIDRQVEEVRQTHSGHETVVLQDQKKDIELQLENLQKRFDAERNRVTGEFDDKKGILDESAGDKRGTLKQQADTIERRIAENRQAEKEELARIRDPERNSSALENELKNIGHDFDNRIDDTRKAVEGERESILNRTSDVRKSLDKTIEDKRQALEKESNFFNRDSKKKELDERFAPSIASLQTELQSLQDRISQLDVAAAIRQLQQEKDKALENARKQYEGLASSGERQRNTIRQQYANTRGPLEEQLRGIMGQLRTLSVDTLLAEAVAARDEKLRSLQTDFEKKRSELVEKRDSFATKLAEALAQNQDQLQPKLEGLQQSRSETVRKYEELRERAINQYAVRQEELKVREQRIATLRGETDKLRSQRLATRDQINRSAEDSQIYRVAALWTGKDSPADVSNRELRVVSLVWFGSLAAITAWTGTLLAFAGLAVRYGRPKKDARPPMKVRQTLRAVRAAFIDIRRRVRQPKIIEKTIEREVVKPVEVIKEVPVDKVVYRDVPHEVVRRELVYVPFFSDDPDLLKKTVSGHGNGGKPNTKPTDDAEIEPAFVADAADDVADARGKA